MRKPNCEECDRLWREYSAATIEHVRLENKLRLAALCRDGVNLDKLTGQVEIAASARHELRAAIHDHESRHGLADAVEAG